MYAAESGQESVSPEEDDDSWIESVLVENCENSPLPDIFLSGLVSALSSQRWNEEASCTCSSSLEEKKEEEKSDKTLASSQQRNEETSCAYSSSSEEKKEEEKEEKSDETLASSKPLPQSALIHGSDDVFICGTSGEEEDFAEVSNLSKSVEICRVWDIKAEQVADDGPPVIESYAPHDPPELFDPPLATPPDDNFSVKDLRYALELELEFPEGESGIESLISDIADLKIS